MVCRGNENRAKMLVKYKNNDELVDVFIPEKKDDNIMPDDHEKIPAMSESLQKQKNWWTKLIDIVKPEKNNDTPQKNSNTEKHEDNELECKQNDHSKTVELIGSPQINNESAVPELKCKLNKLSKKVNVKVAPQKNYDTEKREDRIIIQKWSKSWVHCRKTMIQQFMS